MTDKERIRKIIDVYAKSVKSFSEYIGLKRPQPLYDILKGRNGISKDLAKRISEHCLDFNETWILTGHGSMYTSLGRSEHVFPQESNLKSQNREGIISRLKELRDAKGFATDEEFGLYLGFKEGTYRDVLKGLIEPSKSVLMSICLKTGINLPWLERGEGDMLKPKKGEPEIMASNVVDFVPLIPILAQGGTLNDFTVSVNAFDCERIASPIKGTDFAMIVAGDSMTPEYPSGTRVFIKKINEQAFIDWGKVYVLDTCNGSVIKRVFPSDQPEKVKCVSINPEYPPFEVSFADIFGVYKVMLSMSVK